MQLWGKEGTACVQWELVKAERARASDGARVSHVHEQRLGQCWRERAGYTHTRNEQFYLAFAMVAFDGEVVWVLQQDFHMEEER